MKSRQSIIIIIVFLLSLSSCRGNNEKQSVNENDSENLVDSEIANSDNISDLKPEEMMFLVEGAIDSWMFYNNIETTILLADDENIYDNLFLKVKESCLNRKNEN